MDPRQRSGRRWQQGREQAGGHVWRQREDQIADHHGISIPRRDGVALLGTRQVARARVHTQSNTVVVGQLVDQGGNALLQGEGAWKILAAGTALEQDLGRKIVGALARHGGEQWSENALPVALADQMAVVVSDRAAGLLLGEGPPG